MTSRRPSVPAVLDLVGVGIGPANLALAALADPVGGLRAAFFERSPSFSWHPGLLLEDAVLQVPWLADLVTLVDPTSRWSFLAHLRHRGRLLPFYLSERAHVSRRQYDAYCRWVAESLPTCHFGAEVVGAKLVGGARDGAAVEVAIARAGQGSTERLLARYLVVAIGTEAIVPPSLRGIVESPDVLALHAGDYLRHRDALVAAGHVTVIGGGQSGAEVVLDLLRRRPVGAERLTWLTRSPAFAPMEYSALGLEHFTPDHTRYFCELDQGDRDHLLTGQWQLYKGISARTMAALRDELDRRSLGWAWPDVGLHPGVEVRAARTTVAGQIAIDLHHRYQRRSTTSTTDALVAATGYRERSLAKTLGGLGDRLATDAAGRPCITVDRRLVDDRGDRLPVFVQNAERHTHGVGAPDLGLVAWRAAEILHQVCGRELHPLPDRAAYTTFGLPAGPLAGDSAGASQ